MADVQMPESVPCKFDEKGWAPCKKPSTNGWCSKHEKSKCVSCGEHAVQSCEAAGGFCCGVPLCETCQHGLDGIHVTSEVYNKHAEEQRELERTGKESKRMLEERGVPTGFPRHLKELLDGDRTGWMIRRCWTLELKHSLMGFFPVILKGTKIMVIVSNKELIFRVWESLSPRDSRVLPIECMVNEACTVGYPMQLGSEFEKTLSKPLKLFSAIEIEELFAKDPFPFEWAPGLWGGEISKEYFESNIERMKKEFQVT